MFAEYSFIQLFSMLETYVYLGTVLSVDNLAQENHIDHTVSFHGSGAVGKVIH